FANQASGAYPSSPPCQARRTLRLPSTPRIQRRTMTDTVANDTATVRVMPRFPIFRTATLAVLSDGRVWTRRDLESAVVEHMKLSDELKAERFATGGKRAANRVGWSISMLVRAG